MIPAVGQIEIYPILRFEEITQIFGLRECNFPGSNTSNQLQTFSLSLKIICTLHFGLF